MQIRKLTFACGLAAVAAALWAANDNVAEEVAWVIGDEPIWKSDIEEAYQQLLYERTPIDGDPYCVIPEQLAIDKLFLHQADADTIEVQSSMVTQRVESILNNYVSALGSRERVEQYFNKPFNDIRTDLTETLVNRGRIDQIQSQLTKDVKATPADVRRFFSSLPADSIPYVPLQVEVQLLTVAPVIPQQEIDDIKNRLRDYAERVNSGQSEFSTLAILYSEDRGSATRGGELGFMGRGQLVPEFAAVAFNLNDPRRVSKIVETEFGYHIIQLIEKRGDRVNCRHILLTPKVSDDDLMEAVNRLDSIRVNMIDEGTVTFEEVVAAVSSDKDTRNNRGVMMNQQTGTTFFEMSQLPQDIARQVATLQPGEISKPFIMKDQQTNRDVVAMVKLTARHDGHRATIADDYQLLKNMYEDAERERILAEWIEQKIADTYVRIEEPWRNCTFRHSGWIRTRNSGNE